MAMGAHCISENARRAATLGQTVKCLCYNRMSGIGTRATFSRQSRQVRKEATVTGSCVCSGFPVPGLFLHSNQAGRISGRPALTLFSLLHTLGTRSKLPEGRLDILFYILQNGRFYSGAIIEQAASRENQRFGDLCPAPPSYQSRP